MLLTKILYVLVCLRLGVNHEWPPPPIINDQTVLSGSIVFRQSEDVP